MREAGGGPRLAGEALDVGGIGGERVGDDLDRDPAPEPLVGGAPDDRHAARADDPLQAVAAAEDLGAGGVLVGHRLSRPSCPCPWPCLCLGLRLGLRPAGGAAAGRVAAAGGAATVVAGAAGAAGWSVRAAFSLVTALIFRSSAARSSSSASAVAQRANLGVQAVQRGMRGVEIAGRRRRAAPVDERVQVALLGGRDARRRGRRRRSRAPASRTPRRRRRVRRTAPVIGRPASASRRAPARSR